ncbi:hypothetical protein BH09CHL1_BH09CHL1_15410 [soil metagenome]
MTPIEPTSIQRSIRTLKFDETAIAEIAALLGGEPAPANFRLPDALVLQLDVPSSADRSPTKLTFWPPLRRVDAIADGLVVVFTAVATVDLVEGVEVLFRRQSGEYLIIAIGGKVIVRS